MMAAIGMCLFTVLLAGIAYEQVGRRRDRHYIKQIGQSVDIGGRTLNIHCVGEGGPVVIFESPGAGPGLVWQPIQDEVATFTRSCWYDRAGEGWSDPGPFPRTSIAIAKDLHELLQRAGVPAPYLLVAASFGGLNARVYGHLYPKECAGFVLVDSAHEDEPVRAPRFYLARTAPPSLWRPLDLAFTAAAEIGLIRLLQSPLLSKPRGEQAELRGSQLVVDRLRRQPKSVASSALTGAVMPETLAEARSVTSLRDRPLIVLAAGKPISFGDPAMDRAAAEYQRAWVGELQPRLARLSTRGRMLVLPNSDHGSIPPETIIEAIREVVSEVQQHPDL
jgi:pimeloyl-ACP methyl ester carboxylesterase